MRLCITRLRCLGRLYFRIGSEGVGVGDADVGELELSSPVLPPCFPTSLSSQLVKSFDPSTTSQYV